MSNHPADSPFSSIKGKIWISAVGFAVANFILGIGAYLALSAIISQPLIAVVLTALITGGAFVFFGRWLSAAVLDPIDKVSKLAKSLERSPTDSMPTETGATETDEILQSLQRTNRQLQNMVGIVESVAKGNTNVAFTKLENPDRLSTSFQKMLTKVTDSINAKDELNDMQSVLDQIRNGLAKVRNPETEGTHAAADDEITDAFQAFISDLDALLISVRANASQAKAAAGGVKESLQSVIEREETRVQELNNNAFEFGKAPNAMLHLFKQLAESISAAAPFIEMPAGQSSSEENVNSLNDLRKQVKDAIKRIQRLSERTQKITDIAELAEDLARRSKLVALNVSLQGVEGNGNKTAASALAAEVDSLASRSEMMNKEISSIDEAVSLEIGEVEAALRSTAGEIANISAFVIDSENTVTECRRHFENIVRLQAEFDTAAAVHSEESDRSFRDLAAAIAETENTAKTLRQSETELFSVLHSMEDLHATVNRFRLLPMETETAIPAPQAFAAESESHPAANEYTEPAAEPDAHPAANDYFQPATEPDAYPAVADYFQSAPEPDAYPAAADYFEAAPESDVYPVAEADAYPATGDYIEPAAEPDVFPASSDYFQSAPEPDVYPAASAYVQPAAEPGAFDLASLEEEDSEILEVEAQVLEDLGSGDFEKRSDNYSGGQLLEI